MLALGKVNIPMFPILTVTLKSLAASFQRRLAETVTTGCYDGGGDEGRAVRAKDLFSSFAGIGFFPLKIL